MGLINQAPTLGNKQAEKNQAPTKNQPLAANQTPTLSQIPTIPLNNIYISKGGLDESNPYGKSDPCNS